MKQSGHLNPSEETGTGYPVTSKYGRTPPIKYGGVGSRVEYCVLEPAKITIVSGRCWLKSTLFFFYLKIIILPGVLLVLYKIGLLGRLPMFI